LKATSSETNKYSHDSFEWPDNIRQYSDVENWQQWEVGKKCNTGNQFCIPLTLHKRQITNP